MALSLTSRSVGVTHHPVLWCPDFPLALPSGKAGVHPILSEEAVHSMRELFVKTCRGDMLRYEGPAGVGVAQVVG